MIFPNVWNLISRPQAQTVEIYNCKTLFELVTEGKGQPELVLSAPVKWQLLFDHLKLWFESRAPDK